MFKHGYRVALCLPHSIPATERPCSVLVQCNHICSTKEHPGQAVSARRLQLTAAWAPFVFLTIWPWILAPAHRSPSTPSVITGPPTCGACRRRLWLYRSEYPRSHGEINVEPHEIATLIGQKPMNIGNFTQLNLIISHCGLANCPSGALTLLLGPYCERKNYPWV